MHEAVTYLIIVSVFFQVAAAIVAIRLIWVTKHSTAWMLIACGIFLMSIRRIISLIGLYYGKESAPIDITFEVIGLLTSILMLAGLLMIRPIFIAIKQSEGNLRRALDEKEMLVKEIHHRVKNNLAVVQSLLRLQSGKIMDADVKGLFDESQNRVRAMSMIHERLYKSEDHARLNIAEYVRSLVMQLFQNYKVNASKVRLAIELDDVNMDVDTIIPCGLIVNELVSNALKHAFKDGRSGELYVGLKKIDEGKYSLIVRDNGAGIPKEIDIYKTESLGMQLITSLTKQIGGLLNLKKDGGTEFGITFSGKTF